MSCEKTTEPETKGLSRGIWLSCFTSMSMRRQSGARGDCAAPFARLSPHLSHCRGGAQLADRAQHAHPRHVLFDIALAQIGIRAPNHALVVASQGYQCTRRAPDRTLRNHL